MIHGIWFAIVSSMKLTLKQLEIILKDNETQLLAALKSNDTTRLVELSNHRSIIKDCIIEALYKLLNTKQGVS